MMCWIPNGLSPSTVSGMLRSITPPRCRPPITVWIGVCGTGFAVRADIHDLGVRARAEHEQTQAMNLRHEHALVHRQRVRLPRRLPPLPAEVVLASLLERGNSRNLPVKTSAT